MHICTNEYIKYFLIRSSEKDLHIYLFSVLMYVNEGIVSIFVILKNGRILIDGSKYHAQKNSKYNNFQDNK